MYVSHVMPSYSHIFSSRITGVTTLFRKTEIPASTSVERVL
ncbi:hypothetical protein R2A130_1927 [Ahrensia sp. R2A130]|nr:hypothetical protein R2A130_1927 [Ahrensia sp. R2A130]